MDSRTQLVEQLREVATFMRLLGENEFKVRAFEKGADTIESDETDLAEVAHGKVKLPGVGEGLKTAITEFLKSGEVKAHNELRGKLPPGVLEFMKIPGLGPKKAMTVCEELGVSTIGELEYACNENRVAGLKGFGAAAQKKILDGIQSMKQWSGKRRIDEARELSSEIAAKLRALSPKTEILEAGAIARYAEVVDHLDFVCVGEMKAAALKKGFALEEAVHKAPFDAKCFSGKLPEGIHATVWCVHKAPDAKAWHWFCADESVRPLLAKNALTGWEATWIESVWVGKREPKADTYRVKKDGMVRGVFHNHTTESDGRNSLEEMVHEAERLGYEYIGISDHSQTSFYAGGLKIDALKAQMKKIAELRKKVSIKIFHGVESDILVDGALDYEAKILDQLDFVVGSIHSRFQMDEKEMTARVCRAIRDPRITMWGHPTGRLLLAREPYKLDWKQCFDSLEESGTVIELNANPQRLDVDWRWGAELAKRKIPVCVNPDAHDTRGLSDALDLGSHFAEKAMLPKNLVLNLRGAAEMEKFLAERKHRK